MKRASPFVVVACLSLALAFPSHAHAASVPPLAVDRGGRIGLYTGSVPPPLPGRLVLQTGGWHADDHDPSYTDRSYEVTGTWGPGPSAGWTIDAPPSDRVRIKDFGGLYRPQWIRNGAWCVNGLDGNPLDTTLTVGARLYRYYGATRYMTTGRSVASSSPASWSATPPTRRCSLPDSGISRPRSSSPTARASPTP